MNIPPNIKNHVHILCSNILAATFMGKLDRFRVYDTIGEANLFGLLPKLREWYKESEQFNQDLDELLLNLFTPGEDKHIKYLLQSAQTYESTYLSDVGTGDTQHTHKICYNLAKKLRNHVILSPDYMATYSTLCEAAANCNIQQTSDAFKDYFGDPKQENKSNNKDLTGWISTNFTGEQSTALNNIISNEQSTYECSSTQVITANITSLHAAGDDSTETQAKNTITGGSARKNIIRDQFEKNNAPHYQSYNSSSTLYTTLMMSDLSEITKDVHKHSLLNCMLHQFETSCDSVTKIAGLLAGDITQTEDRQFTEQDSIKLYNRTLSNQIGNRGLIMDNNNKAITRDKTDETSTN